MAKCQDLAHDVTLKSADRRLNSEITRICVALVRTHSGALSSASEPKRTLLGPLECTNLRTSSSEDPDNPHGPTGATARCSGTRTSTGLYHMIIFPELVGCPRRLRRRRTYGATAPDFCTRRRTPRGSLQGNGLLGPLNNRLRGRIRNTEWTARTLMPLVKNYTGFRRSLRTSACTMPSPMSKRLLYLLFATSFLRNLFNHGQWTTRSSPRSLHWNQYVLKAVMARVIGKSENNIGPPKSGNPRH